MNTQRRFLITFHFSQYGQSLLEVLLASALVSLVLVSVLSVIIASLANSRSALEQSKSNQYNQEILEWLRHGRDQLGWTTFAEFLPTVGSNQTYCLPSVPDGMGSLASTVGACQPGETISSSQYSRSLLLTRTSDSELNAQVTVSRPDKSGIVTTTDTLTLTEWQ